MPVEIDMCAHIDFSPTAPDNLQPPLCKIGYGWSSDCMKPNGCPYYCHMMAITLLVKKQVGQKWWSGWREIALF